jgi:hypothetical protein
MATLPGEGILGLVSRGQTILTGATPQGAATPGATSVHPTIPGTNIQATNGWYVAVGCIGAIFLAGTPVAPVVLAVMSIAALFQLINLLQGT